MHSIPSTFTSNPNFASIFDAALESYRRKTKKDLASHPLLPRLQSCDSPDAILSVFREQISAFDKTEDGFTKWVIPTVNVLHGFSSSDMLGQAVGLAFTPASIIFTGINVLLSAAKDASACQQKLIDVFNRIGRFFQRLDKYTGITPTNAMMDMVVEIMVEVINILAITTKEVKRGRLKRYFKKLAKNTDIEDSLERLDKLTEEEARMARAELLKLTDSVYGKVKGIDDRVKDVGEDVQDVRDAVQDVDIRVQGIEESVQAVQIDVNGAVYTVQLISSDIKDISSKLRDVDDKLDRDNQNQLGDNILRWLSAPDPSINHNIARKAHHGGTAQWFFQLEGGIFNQWKSSGSLLWIYGKPGSGKTVLCSSIVENINAAGKTLMANFYFDFGDVDKQNLRNLLPSLLIQLSAQSNRCCDLLSQLYSEHNHGRRKPSDSDMVECLKNMLCFEKQASTYIIMDALDECPITSTIPSPREEVLEFVEELVGLQLPNLHICVTSRPEHDIRVVIEPLTEHPVSLHDESGQREDIANYVAFCVGSNRRMRRWREEDRKLVIKTLSEKADGMFRWTFCQLEILRDCLPSSIRRILEELPNSLDETYERILKKIRKPNQEHAHRLLQCLAVAARPLRVQELAEVLAFDFDAEGIPELNLNWRWKDQEEAAVMSTCSSLVIIVKDGDSRIVQFSHFSVKEFLTADRLAEPIRDVSRYHIRLDTAHTVFVRACLGVLLRLDDDVDRDNVKNFPLAPYSAQHWTTHAQFQDVSSRVKDGMECLFDTDKPHFATWLWIYNNDQDGHSMCTMKPEKPEATPLYYAASFGFRDLAEHLIAKHPEHVMAKGGEMVTAMHAAAGRGYADILPLLLEHGAKVDVPGLSRQTPLLHAAWCGKVDAGKCLLDHGANIDARCDGEATPLFYAAIWGRVEFVRMLLERGAAVDVRNDAFSSPLHWAAQGGEIQVVRLLLKHGAVVNARTVFDETPSQVASGPKRQEIVKLLSEYGAQYV